MKSEEIFENYSALQHIIWARFVKYMFMRGRMIFGRLVLPVRETKRWLKQAVTDYQDLSEKEKDANRLIAHENLSLLSQYMNDVVICDLNKVIRNLVKEKDGAYTERNALVCLLSKIYPSSLGRHPENEDWEDDWRWIVFINLPTGQATWHIHDSELPNFSHLPRFIGEKWDGHTTEEKYERIKAVRSNYNVTG